MFTKELRQQIIRDFAVRHNGNFNPALFLGEVERTGENHPAHGWFEWDNDEAARQHRVWQAREFAAGLRVKFSVEEVVRGKVSVREVEMPFAISPIADRSKGGGYYVADNENPEHMGELCRQAATSLQGWLRRYQAALVHAGGSVVVIDRQLALLEKAVPAEEVEAA